MIAIDPQKLRQLAVSTTLTMQTARWFLELLSKWQQESNLTDAQAEKIQQLAIDTASKVGITSPLAVLQAMYGAAKIVAKGA